MSNSNRLSRRKFLQLSAGAAFAPWVPSWHLRAAEQPYNYTLVAKEAKVRLAREPFPETQLWTFGGQSPGPLLRMKQGEKVRIALQNEMERSTTVHWHGMRIPNAVDGVPFLTQEPVVPGDEFIYEFTPPDAGTYWYHSHFSTTEQVGRGLYGPIIVEERNPIEVDRDILWVLDDWRLDKNAQIIGDFNKQRDLARAGRLGNTITVNGQVPESFHVRSGERIRLRLLNSSNARIFSLRFQGHRVQIIARDGQPLEPYELEGSAIELGPAQRIDLIVDMMGLPGDKYRVVDTFFPQSPFLLRDIVYSNDKPMRFKPLDRPFHLEPNPLPEPDMNDPLRRVINLDGGDLGQLTHADMHGKRYDVSKLYLLGKMWSINGIVATGYKDPPLFTVERGRTVILHFKNRTMWPHPMHLHGHSFKVLRHTGNTDWVGQWLDTVMVRPGEEADVAFVADNPGDWLFHCHILAHARAGMLAVVKVE